MRSVIAAGADLIHFDVMDNHYVPNLTVGPLVCRAIKPHATVPIDVHLMVKPVDALVPMFAQAGADIISFHPEASEHVDRTIQLIRSLGVKAALVLNPATPLAVLDHVIDQLDLVLLMTVNPGFGGQSFIPGMLPRSPGARAGRRGHAAHGPRDLAGGGWRRQARQRARHRRGRRRHDGGGSAVFHRRARRSRPTAARSRAYAARRCAGSKACWSRHERRAARDPRRRLRSRRQRWSTARPDIQRALNSSLRREGRPRFDLDRVRGWIGDGPDALIARALEAQGCSGDDVALRARLRRWFDAATLPAPLAGGTVTPASPNCSRR